MISPREFRAGGMEWMGLELDCERGREVDVDVDVDDVEGDSIWGEEGEGEREEIGLVISLGRGKKKERGFERNFERSGGWRVLKNMLKARRARFV